MNAIIIDDEPFASKNLHAILKLFEQEVSVIAIASSAVEGIERIDELKPDLLFLDIEMPGGDGFEVLEKTSFKGYQVIFITAYSEYAIKALRMNALDYITKPVDPDELTAAIQRAKQNLGKQQSNTYQELINGHQKGRFERLAIPTMGGLKYIDLKEIIRLESSSNYTTIYTQKEKPTLVSKTLKSFDQTLSDSGFIRVHQSHLVNQQYITEFHRGDGSYLVLSNKDKVPVSKSKRGRLKEKFRLT